MDLLHLSKENMSDKQVYSLDDFAKKIKKYDSQYEDWNNYDLVSMWINKDPRTEKMLDNPLAYYSNDPTITGKEVSYWKPDHAAGHFDNFLYKIQKSVVDMPSWLAGTVAEIVKPADHSLEVLRQIADLEADINNNPDKPDYWKANRQAQIDRFREIRLPKAIQSDKHDKTPGLGFGSGTYNKRKEYEKYWRDISKTWKKSSEEWTDNYLRDDPQMQAYLDWQRDTPLTSWKQLANPSIMARTFTDLSASMAAGFGPTIATGGAGMILRGAGALSKSGRVLNWSDKLMKASNVASKGALPIMFAMEASDQYNQILDYMTKEYEWEGPDGQKLKGISYEDAMAVAVRGAAIYGSLSIALERFQMNKIAGFLGVRSGYKKAMLTRIADKIMSKYAPKVTTKGAYKFGVDIFDIPAVAWEEGLIEGWQAGLGFLTTESVIQGYGNNPDMSFANIAKGMVRESGDVGILNIAYPYTSKIPEVKESALAGAGGFLIPGIAKIGGSRTVGRTDFGKEYGRFVDDAIAGDDVEIKNEGNNVIAINNTTGNVAVFPADNESEANDLVLQFGAKFQSLSEFTDYGRLLLAQDANFEAPTHDDIVPVLKKDHSKKKTTETENKILALIERDSKSDRGKEASISVKVANLIEASGDPNILDKAIIDPDPEEVNQIKLLEEQAANELKKRAEKNILPKIKDKRGEKALDALLKTAEHEINKIESKEILGQAAHGALDAFITSKLNAIEEIFLDDEKQQNKAIDEIQSHSFSQAEKEYEQQHAGVDPMEQLEEKALDAWVEKSMNIKIHNINDSKLKAAPLLMHLTKKLGEHENPNIAKEQIVKFIVNPKEGIYATNFGKILKALKIPFKNADLQDKNTKVKLAEEVAERIVNFIVPNKNAKANTPVSQPIGRPIKTTTTPVGETPPPSQKAIQRDQQRKDLIDASFELKELKDQGVIINRHPTDPNRIGEIVVPENMRNKGVGTKIVNALKKEFKAKNKDQIKIISDPSAVGFWNKMGFEEYGKTTDFVLNTKTGKQEQARLMRFDIVSPKSDTKAPPVKKQAPSKGKQAPSIDDAMDAISVPPKKTTKAKEPTDAEMDAAFGSIDVKGLEVKTAESLEGSVKSTEQTRRHAEKEASALEDKIDIDCIKF